MRNSLLPCAKCRSVGRRCFACSRDARDAEDNVVGREHERVRIRMTRQNVSSTVAGDQGADSPLETDVDVRVTSPPCFFEREAGAGALARRAQETPGRNMDLIQVCHTHKRLKSDSEVIVLEQVSICIYDQAWPFSTTDAQKNPFLSRRLAQSEHRKRQQHDVPRRRKGNARRTPRNEAELHCFTEATFQMIKWPSFSEGVHHH